MKAFYICLDLMEKGWDRPNPFFKRKTFDTKFVSVLFLLQPDMHGSKGVGIKIKGFKF